MSDDSDQKRVAFSPGEFAALFGKSQTWGYRQLYSGKVKSVTEYGRIMIPAAEVERVLATAGVYNGEKQKIPKSKAEIERLKPKLRDAWSQYILNREMPGPKRGYKPAAKTVKTQGKLPWQREGTAPSSKLPWVQRKPSAPA